VYPVSDAFLRTIAGAHRVAASLEFHASDGTWQPLELSKGNVSADRTSQTRWSLTATVLEPPGSLSPFGSMLRAHRGVYLPDGTVEWVPSGVFRCESVKRQTGSPEVDVTGLSAEKIVADGGFLVPRNLHGGSGVASIRELITEVLPGAYVDVRVPDQILGSLTEDKDRWGMIDGSSDSPSIAKLLGAEVYADGLGRFVIGPVPTVDDPPVWTAGDGVLVSADSELSRDGVVNVWVVTGASAGEDNETVGPGYALDTDPYSPTFAGSSLFDPTDVAPFGRVIDYYSSSALKDQGDCERAAAAKLADSLGLKHTVSFESVLNPALRPGDVVRIAPPGVLAHNHVIDKLTVDLAGSASLKADTRTSRQVTA
jgi:hypothetical protein